MELLRALKSTHSTPWSEAGGMLRIDTERRFLPRFKNRGVALSNVSNLVKEDHHEDKNVRNFYLGSIFVFSTY